MEVQTWIFAQIGIDVVMVALLIWFLISQNRRQMSWRDYEEVIQKSEAILSEMGEISQSLEKNLHEKKVLSHRILEQLEQGLQKAEESYRQISEIIPKSANDLGSESGSLRNANRTRSSVLSLLKKGLPKEEIAQHLGISVGEIDLLIKLQPPSDVV